MPSPAAPPTEPLVLVCGDDDYSVKQRARQIFQDWSAALGGMDHEIIDAQAGNSTDALKALARLRESLQTLPFFGTGKAIWFQNCTFLGDERTASTQVVTENLADLADQLKAFSWDRVRLLISAGKVDKRKTFFKTIDKLGRVESFAALSLEDRDWTSRAEEVALQKFRAAGKQIDDEALAELVQAVGPNLRQLHNEIEKLTLYLGDRSAARLEDVTAIVTRQKQARAFALSDALGNRDLPRALRCLDEEFWEMKTDREKSEIGVLYGLIAKVRVLILVHELLREKWIRPERDFNRFKAALSRVPAANMPDDKRYNPLALNPYLLFKALPQAGRYSLPELVRAMDLLLNCNQRLIFSGLDPKLVLQQTLIEIIGSPRSTATVP